MKPVKESLARWEPLAGMALAALGLIHFALFAYVMLPSSLWIDEIISIRDYSGQGPLTAVTSYREPNNHIFFNLLQSLMPWAGSYEPAPARLLALSFSLLGAIGSAAIFMHRRLWIEGGAAVLAFFYSTGLLGVLLNARGYSLQFLISVAMFWCLLRHYETGSRRQLVIACLLAAAGVWAATSFLLLWIPIAAMLLAVFPTRATLESVGISVAAMLLVHIPVLGPLCRVYLDYGGDHGRFFESWSAVLQAAGIWLGTDNRIAAVILLILPAIVAAAAWWSGGRSLRRIDGLALVLVVASFASLGLARLAGTPPPRVFAGTYPLFLLPAVLAASRLIRPKLGAAAITVAATAGFLFVALIYPGKAKLDGVHHLPVEDWKGTAAFIEKAFPPGTRVWSFFRPELLRLYLDDAYPGSDIFDREAFDKSGLVVVDSDFWAADRVSARMLEPSMAEVRIPQLRNGYQAVLFKPSVHGADVTMGMAEDPAGTRFLQVTITAQENNALSCALVETGRSLRLAAAIVIDSDGEDRQIGSGDSVRYPGWTLVSLPPGSGSVLLLLEPAAGNHPPEAVRIHAR